jgi:hypothetical protein
MKRLLLIASLMAGLCVLGGTVDSHGPTMAPDPWDSDCVVIDSIFPFIHIVSCPEPSPAPPQPNPSPRGCQDCIEQ